MRFCNGCTQLDKRLKNPCKKGFNAVIGKVETIRPTQCKKKYKKEKEIDYKKVAVDNFQMYIRYRDNWTCVVCGKHIDPNDPQAKMLLHGGHYISRIKTSLLLDEKNCHGQCRECNGRQNWEGIDPRYTQYLIRKYGIEILDYLNKKKNEIYKPNWKELAEYWEQKLNEIKGEQNDK